MNDDRQDKLKQLKHKQAAKSFVVASVGEPFIEALQSKIDELKKTLGVGIELNNLDDLLEQLALVQSFQQEVKELKESIKTISLPESIQLDNLEGLIKAIRDSKSVPAKVFNKPLSSKAGTVSNPGVTSLVKGNLRVYAFSLSTVSTEQVTIRFRSGDADLWSLVLQAPPNIATGANLAINPPSYLFSSQNDLSISLSRQADVKWAVSYYEE